MRYWINVSALCMLSPELQIRCVKWTSIDFTCLISSPNSVFDHLLESSHWDDFNKWSNIEIGEEMEILEIEIRTLSGALRYSKTSENWILTLSLPNKLLSAIVFICLNFQSALMSLKVCENVVWVSNSLDQDETTSYSEFHSDPSCLHMVLWSW